MVCGPGLSSVFWPGPGQGVDLLFLHSSLFPETSALCVGNVGNSALTHTARLSLVEG